VGFCEHCHKPLGSVSLGEFFDQLKDYQLLKKDSFHGLSLFSGASKSSCLFPVMDLPLNNLGLLFCEGSFGKLTS
jgi:hypothetical protein